MMTGSIFEPIFTPAENGTSMMFGKHIDCFEGILDEVAIFNVGLTKDDIQAIMNRGLEGAGTVDLSGKLPTTWASIKNQ